MTAQIISLGYAVPEYEYQQDDIFNKLGYSPHFRRLFRESQIEQRYFCIPADEAMDLTFQQQQDKYIELAPDLSIEAIVNCLDGRDPDCIGCLTYVSCSGFAPGPTIGHEIARRLGMRDDLIITNITSMGCEAGGMPGLRRAADYTEATGKPSLVVATELCSLTHFPEPNGAEASGNFELARANAVFGDGSSAALIGVDGEVDHPYIVDSLVYTKREYQDKLGYVWQDGRLRVRLSKDVPRCAAEVSMEAVNRMLVKHDLSCGQIQHWIVHGAGMAVLDNIEKGLNLRENDLNWSRKVLRSVGNVSSATVGICGKFLMDSEAPKKGDLGLIVTVGPGLSGGCTLLSWSA